jgi:PAS domain S-box-containing protein
MAEEAAMTDRRLPETPDGAAQLGRILDAVGAILWRADAATLRFQYVSEEAERLLGYPRRAWLEEPDFWRDHLHPDDRERAVAFCLEQTARRAHHAFEYRMLAADGRVVWLRDKVRVVEEAGQPTALVGVMLDVTPLKEAEAARRESERRFREIAENIREVFWMTDPEKHRMIYISPAYEQIWGRTCASLYETPLSFVEAIHPQDRDRVLQRMAVQPLGQYDEVYRILRPDGALRWIRDRAFPVRAADGAVTRIVGSAQDITELKQAEDALRLQKEALETIVESIPVMIVFFDREGRAVRVNREFERVLGWSAEEARRIDLAAACYPDPEHRRQVAEFIAASTGGWGEFRTRTRDGRTVDTVWANVRLSDGTILGVGEDVTERRRLEQQFRQAQKIEAVGRLAGGVAHDFNNLLAVITGYAELALLQLGEDHPAAAKIREALKAGARGAALTGQLLAFSRRQVLEPKRVDLNALVANMEGMLRRLIGEDVELAVRLHPDLGTVRVDPGQIEQALMNLAVNSRDAMPRGGTLTLETANTDAAELLATAHWKVEPGAYVRLSVADTGAGMDAATLARLFEPFFTPKPTGEGPGLGLAMAYGFVKQSGGHILVESAVGRGTTFRIYLPRVAGSAPPSVTAFPDEAAGGHETILLVEDQDVVREVTRQMLAALGYQVLAAESPEAALALADRHPGPIHLLLTDVVMPRLSGRDLARRLTAAHPDTRVLFMSGYTSDVLGRQGVELASDVVLIEKPFKVEELGRKVREVLRRRPPTSAGGG